MNLRLCFAWLLLVFGLTFALADDFDRRVSDIVILQAKPVQRELGITEAQRTAMNQAADAHRTRLMAYQKQLDASKSKPSQTVIFNYYQQLKEQVLNQLSPAQIRRLRELSLQHAGLLALGDEVIAKRVGLSQAQIDQERKDIIASQKGIRAVTDATAKPIYQRFAGKKPKTRAEAEQIRKEFDREVGAILRPKLGEMAKRDRAQMLAVLTPAQKANWKALQGRPFRG